MALLTVWRRVPLNIYHFRAVRGRLVVNIHVWFNFVGRVNVTCKRVCETAVTAFVGPSIEIRTCKCLRTRTQTDDVLLTLFW